MISSAIHHENDHNDNELLPSSHAQKSTSFKLNSESSRKFCTLKTESKVCESSSPSVIVTSKAQKQNNRTRKKGPLKLRFHHQALPPEYLSHFETQQNLQQNQEILKQKQQQQQQQQVTPKKKSQARPHVALAPPAPVAQKLNSGAKLNSENIINWLQNILEMQKTDEVKSTTPKIRNIPIEVAPTTSRTQCLKDLPYMGEMTLENMKPRRGRKPKKADICHLIYKNYGTIVSGSVAPTSVTSTATSTSVKKVHEASKKRPSPLMIKKAKEIMQPKPSPKLKAPETEPLNLCTRETKIQSEDSSIIISDDSNDFAITTRVKELAMNSCDADSIDLEFSSTIPSLISPLDLSGDLPSANSVKEFLQSSNKTPPLSSSASSPATPTAINAPPGYVYWPSAGLFIHPMALYYQKMVDGKINQDSSTSSSSSSLSSILNNEAASLWEQSLSSYGVDIKNNPDLDLENLTQMIKSENLLNSPTPALSELLKNASLKSPPQPSTSGCQTQKRKRSAIYIPPVQTENTTNPNEVSICKFKFTGGAKPSLQEKKILSVDAGGNFRYYSGTGDKSMRGYEFFPRESLMQSCLSSSGSHTNAFLNAASEKIPLEMLPPISVDLNNKLLNLSDVDTSTILDSNFNIENLSNDSQMRSETNDDEQHRKKKKSSNRSIQRAKLEKTFREKGFLIQTQQLQSAEGATYCKFRQLRKFTRYLFRSWKDYLPSDENLPQLVDQLIEKPKDVPTSCS